MTKEEMKNKYSSFITEISEILGLGKPVDILKLCATTDLFFQPLENHIAELEKENAELKTRVENQKSFLKRIRAKFNLGEIDRKEIEVYLEGDQLIKAKEIIKRLLKETYGEGWNYSLQVKVEAEKFLKESE